MPFLVDFLKIKTYNIIDLLKRLRKYYRRLVMKFGHFDDKNYEYVITNYKTPLPWINYFGQDGFFSLISNFSVLLLFWGIFLP